MLIKNNISQIVLAIAVLFVAIFLLSPLAEAAVIEKDLGVVLYTQAPKTWTIDVPQNFNKVEVGVYPMGKTEINQYGGWNGYLKLNGQYVWKFVRHDTTLGGIIYDYINGAEVLETTGRGKWLDVTSKISAGGNTVTFYHYTGGDGIGVKVRIYTTTTTPAPTPTPTPTPAPTITPAPATGASISLYGISSSYYAGDTLTATVYVKNTGGIYHTFPVGFSVRDPLGTWIDVPYKTATLSAGADTSTYFEYKIPSSGHAGTWTARAAVWDRDAGGGILNTRYDYDEKSFSVVIPATPTITATPVQEESGVVEKDLGVVLYTQAPKTWTIDVPANFNKVEIGVYAKGKTEVNQYGGWNGYLKLNEEYAWKFVRHDTALGGIFYDYIKGMEVMETTARGKWLDVTGKISAGQNTVTFYHYTGGDGIGVKVKIYTAALTPVPTPTKTPFTMPLTTPKPTQIIPGKYTREGPQTIEESVRIYCESSDPSEVSLYKISNDRGFICVNNVVYNALRIKLKTVDPYGTPVSDVEVSKQVIDKAQIVMDIITDQFAGLIVGAALGAAGVPTVILKAMDVKDLIENLIKFPEKIQKLGEDEYVVIGKTDKGGFMETWVTENQETRFEAVEKRPAMWGPVAGTETDHSIQKLLGKYLWRGRATITTSSPKTEEIRLGRGASVVVMHGKGSGIYEHVEDLRNFFKKDFGMEIVSMTFETAESQKNLWAKDELNKADIQIYLLTAEDAPSPQIYTYDRFMPTFKTSGFFSGASIVDENGIEYRDKSNGVVSYQYHESEKHYNGRNYYLIAGMGNEGLKSAIDAFKKGEGKIVVGPESSKPAPARRPWWKFW